MVVSGTGRCRPPPPPPPAPTGPRAARCGRAAMRDAPAGGRPMQGLLAAQAPVTPTPPLAGRRRRMATGIAAAATGGSSHRRGTGSGGWRSAAVADRSWRSAAVGRVVAAGSRQGRPPGMGGGGGWPSAGTAAGNGWRRRLVVGRDGSRGRGRQPGTGGGCAAAQQSGPVQRARPTPCRSVRQNLLFGSRACLAVRMLHSR